ncbi:hypothetical protein EDB83DRAFT_1483268 [Lactarius deliciosus]|nr:hypothetical protein EDB83DRAFT_1483268 [Lactarius deliciosus]
MTRRLTPPSPIPRLKYAQFDSYPNSASEPATRIWMPNDVEKECERARRQRVREAERRRENERRLEGQRWEFERKCEALRRKKAAADEENDAALAKNGRDEDEVLGGACENRVGEGDKPQPHRDAAPWSNDQGRRPGKLKRRNRRARAKGETDAERKTPAGRASPAPAKKEHPGLHVIAQSTPLAPPLPPKTPYGESSLHSGKSETCRQGEDFQTSMGVDYLFDPPLRCTPLVPDASAPPPAVEESAQTREAAADVLFFEPQLLYVERSDSIVDAIVPIVKIGRASAAFYRNSGEPGNTRRPQILFRGRGRGMVWTRRSSSTWRAPPDKLGIMMQSPRA